MTEKRYYKKDYDELYYIFDSKTLTEKEFEKKVEYDGYAVFADSLTSKEVLDLLNENEQLKQQMQRLYNYFGDWFDEIVPSRNFSEIWDGVKEDEEWD